MKTTKKYKTTSNQIKQLFLSLLKTKPIEEINITEICQTLSINRSTFYRHFEDIYALLKEVGDDLLLELKAVYDDIAQKEINSVDTMCEILTFIEDNKEIYSLLMIYQRDHKLWDKINEMSATLFADKINQKYPASKQCNQRELMQAIQFVSSGFYSLYKDWLENDCKEDKVILAGRLSNLSDSCIESVLKQNM